MEASHHNTNRYLFHWLSTGALEAFDRIGVLKPKWRHWILDESRFVKGISTCAEPMVWSPDEELPREPCLVIDKLSLTCQVHAIDSGEAYYLTKEIRQAERRKGDVEAVINRARTARRHVRSRPDEYFIEGRLGWENVIAIGFEEDDEGIAAKAAAEVAERRVLPTVDMTGWRVSDPGYKETDEIIEENIQAHGIPSPARPGPT